jgi:hypothetical protein
MRVVRSCAAASVFVLIAVGTVQPQSGAPSLVQVTTTIVKPSMVAEYEDYVKKIGAAGAKVGQTQRVSVYQVTHGTRNFTYLSAARLANWAALDAMMSPAEAILKAHGDVEGAKIVKAGRSAMESSTIELLRYRTELSTNFKLLDPVPAFAQLIRTQIKPDAIAAYEEYITRLKTAQEQTPNHPTAIRLTTVAGPAQVYTAVQYHNRFADRDSWPNPSDVLRKGVGEAETRRLLEISSRAIEHRETWVLRYRADLSRGAPRTTSH